MALGKNLKKQQLIPGEEKAMPTPKKKQPVKAEKKATTPKSAGSTRSKAKKSPAKKAKPATKKAAEKVTKEPLPNVQSENAAPQTITTREESRPEKPNPFRYISQAEKERRDQLKARFNHELQSLKGKRVHLIVFKLGSEEYAIEISKTREVVVTPEISKAPHAPAYVRGVADIRGSVIMAVDLAMKFRLQKDESNKAVPPYTLVLNHTHYKVGILIDEVPVTLVIDGDRINNSTGVMTDDSIHETFIKGVIREKNRMIFYVDIDGLLEADSANVLPEAVEQNEVN